MPYVSFLEIRKFLSWKFEKFEKKESSFFWLLAFIDSFPSVCWLRFGQIEWSGFQHVSKFLLSNFLGATLSLISFSVSLICILKLLFEIWLTS